MSEITRRGFFGAAGTTAAAALLGACSSGSNGQAGVGSVPGGPAAGAGGNAGSLRWWDHFSALQKFHKQWAAKESDALGIMVDHTYNDASRAQEALQLAHQSKQLPDVYSNVVGLPLASLVKENWVQALTLTEQASASLPDGSLTEGITNVDGKVYGVPLFTFRQYSTATWMNRQIIDGAGLDPASPPKTYDKFRAACKKVKTSGGGVAPMILALGDPGRMRDQVNDLAQAAGFPGLQGMKFLTGEYAFEDESYIQAIEFWKGLNDSGYIVQGSGNFTVVNARSRYAAGVAGFFPDGPWCAGGVKAITPSFLPKMAVGPILAPNSGTVAIYRGAPAPQFFVAGSSAHAEKASALVNSFTTAEYQKGLASGMDQPPINLEVVDNADVIEPYRKVVGFFQKTCYRAPEAVVANPQIVSVQAESKPISPHLGNIVQGYLGGNITDLRASLKKLSEAFSKDRDRALASAKTAGATVSLDDWTFKDWKPGTDYTYK